MFNLFNSKEKQLQKKIEEQDKVIERLNKQMVNLANHLITTLPDKSIVAVSDTKFDRPFELPFWMKGD